MERYQKILNMEDLESNPDIYIKVGETKIARFIRRRLDGKNYFFSIKAERESESLITLTKGVSLVDRYNIKEFWDEDSSIYAKFLDGLEHPFSGIEVDQELEAYSVALYWNYESIKDDFIDHSNCSPIEKWKMFKDRIGY